MKKIVVSLVALTASMSALAQQNEENLEEKSKANILNEVVVSGNREEQKRKDVPAAITVVDAEEIDIIKPIGVEQVLNNTPGVYISTSKASSNEQHFAAARSPITTRALFLYLEDGIPIRPTAVFNHNALLELNNIATERIEVLKGPASSIYGSEAIGGSFNFITKNPTKEFSGSIKAEHNSLGLSAIGVELSNAINKHTGVYVSTEYRQRENGPFGHSDFEKLSSTVKFVSKLSDKIQWTNNLDLIDFRTDTSGSISQADYDAKDYSSDQTFTERDAEAIRYRSTFDAKWNENNKTSFSQIFRYNDLDQIPSFRFSNANDETGLAVGEINSNKFKSFAGLIQHKLDIPSSKLSIVGGASIDFSPQEFISNTTEIVFDPVTDIRESFTVNGDDFIANYDADLLNYAFYTQADFKPFDYLTVTAGLRYDKFEYDFVNNIVDGIVEDGISEYENFAPKLGVNVNVNNNIGFYANWSTGFTPPQASTLYRSGEDDNTGLRPSDYDNFEIGTYLEPVKGLKVELAGYVLEGNDVLLSITDDNGVISNVNAGKTRSFGVEYGITYQPFKTLTISHNGSFANHRYIDFQDGDTILDDTDREIAPKLLGTSRLIFNPVKDFTATLTHELVGKYNTSFENQATDEDGNPTTATYAGHNVFDLSFSLKRNHFEFWVQLLNIFDTQFANRADFNARRNENRFTVGNNRTAHAGVKYNF